MNGKKPAGRNGLMGIAAYLKKKIARRYGLDENRHLGYLQPSACGFHGAPSATRTRGRRIGNLQLLTRKQQNFDHAASIPRLISS